jgi:hypothetical protein
MYIMHLNRREEMGLSLLASLEKCLFMGFHERERERKHFSHRSISLIMGWIHLHHHHHPHTLSYLFPSIILFNKERGGGGGREDSAGGQEKEKESLMKASPSSVDLSLWAEKEQEMLSFVEERVVF